MSNNVPLVFVDTETTGLSFKRQTWEVAMIRDNVDGTTEEVQFFLPVYNRAMVHVYDGYHVILGDEVNEKSLQVGKFYDRYPRWLENVENDDYKKQVWSIPKAAAEIYRMTHGAHFVGMCPDFDAFNLWRILQAAGINDFPWYYQVIDVDMMIYGRHGGDLPVNTNYWAEKYGAVIAEEDRHTAMGDAKWTRDLYYRVLKDEYIIDRTL